MSTFAQLIADPYAERQILATISAYDGSSVVTLRYSERGFNSLPSDSVPNEHWSPRIVEAPTFRRSMFSADGIGGQADTDYGTLVLANASDSAESLDALRTYAFDGRAVELRMLGRLSDGSEVTYDNAGIIFSGTCDGDAILTEDTVTIRLRGNEWLFEQPIQTKTYRGMSHCLAFDGVDDYATLSTHDSQSSCTIEFWMRCDGNNGAANEQDIIALAKTSWDTSHIDFNAIVTAAGKLVVGVHRSAGGAGTTINGPSDVRDGFFHHVAITLTSGTNGAKLYYDGELYGQATTGTFSALTGATLTVGARLGGGSNFFNGRIDEVRFWKSTLTQAQIQASMNSELAAPLSTAMFGYWKLNDNTGAAPADSSGNSKTGSLPAATATPTWSSSLSGDANIAGTPIPIVYGAVANAQPVLIDATRLIYQVHDGRNGQPLNRISAVYDKGVSISGYTADLARGLITLTASPAGTITIDCDGESTFQSALSLDGSSAYVNATPTCPAGSMTMEMLFKPSASIATRQVLCGFRNGAAAAGVRIIDVAASTANVARLACTDNAGVTRECSAAAFTDFTRWYHVAGVLDTSAGTLSLYIDGALAASSSTSGSTFTTVLSNFDVGRLGGSSSNYFSGSVDEVRIWNSARTQQQIQDNASKELLGTETGLVQYWKYNERTGSSLANAVSGASTATANGSYSWEASRASAWDLVRRVVAGRTSLSSFDDDGITAANLLTSARCGMYVSEPDTTIGDVVSFVISGGGGFYYFTRTGTLAMGRFSAPSSGGSAFTTLEILGDGDIAQQPLEPPTYRVEVGWRKNWTVFSENEVALALSTSALASRRAFVTNEWRFEPAIDTSIQTAYSGAQVFNVETSLYNLTDAQAEAQRLLTLHGAHREMWSVPLFAQPYTMEIGQSMSMTMPRFGMDSGRDFVVVGFTESPDGIDAEVWG